MNLEFFTTHFASLGPWLFFIGAMAEALPLIGTFLPGATIVTLGGFMAAQGYFSLSAVIAFSIAGAITGDAISYYTGIYGGTYIRNKKIIPESLLQKGEVFFNKYGSQSLVWGRFIGPIRAIIPFLAGMSKLKAKTFWIMNLISGISWGFFYVMLGHVSGNLIALILNRWSGKLTWAMLALTVIPILVWFYKHHGESLRQYFRDRSAELTSRIAQYNLVQKLEKRNPVINEFFGWKTFQYKLYFSIAGFVILITLTILTIIFDWL